MPDCFSAMPRLIFSKMFFLIEMKLSATLIINVLVNCLVFLINKTIFYKEMLHVPKTCLKSSVLILIRKKKYWTSYRKGECWECQFITGPKVIWILPCSSFSAFSWSPCSCSFSRPLSSFLLVSLSFR